MFGYPPVEGCEFAWGARAIFNPLSKYPLDILHDRQYHQVEETQKGAFQDFADFINKTAMPMLRDLSAYFDSSSGDKLVWHFEWPHDPSKVVVAMGSPNASYGYFYLSVSLIDKDKAPAVIKPKGYLTPEEQAEKKAEMNRRAAEREAEYNRQRQDMTRRSREVNKAARERVAAVFANAAFKRPGEPLVVGDQITINANQADRQALVKAVLGEEALVEYFMPKGSSFLRIIRIANHAEVRVVSAKALPKKWKALIA